MVGHYYNDLVTSTEDYDNQQGLWDEVSAKVKNALETNSFLRHPKKDENVSYRSLCFLFLFCYIYFVLGENR